ncbi:GNAT family N-acetyltransferase [Segetibacter sp. 3557_3]|uniref:GNAT family N-acetyltransferase n=1 Tax=Segetibacter sp. 3557_3 TaxID=2547429 RepID=UPI001404385B|nr:GNAT family N-acetyltransferase [Segetibacter sp. 3557_3]
MYKIARCTSNDVAELHALVNMAYRGPESKEGWTSEADLIEGLRINQDYLRVLLLQPNVVLLKCTIDDQLAGCVSLEMVHFTCHLGMLSVMPVLQNLGIGKLLVDASGKVARSLGCKQIQITVISVRTELIEWYKRLGFQDTGERQPFPVKDQTFGTPRQVLEFLIMQKPLTHENLR